MKEIIGKTKLSEDSPPKHIFHGKVSIFVQKTIAEHFNKLFIGFGTQLAEK